MGHVRCAEDVTYYPRDIEIMYIANYYNYSKINHTRGFIIIITIFVSRRPATVNMFGN